MAKMLKQLVFGQKKNPPAPPRPDYEGNKSPADLPFENQPDVPFFDHDYENIPKFKSKGGSQVRFAEKKEPELVVFENYSEPADLRAELSALEEADPLYMSPLDDQGGTAPPPPEEEEDMYCVPYDTPEAETAPALPLPCLAQQVLGMVAAYSSPASADMLRPGSRFIRITPNEITWIASLPPLAGVFGNAISGYLSHVLGRRAVLMFVSASYTFGWLAIAYAPNIAVVYVGRLLTGLCAGICSVAVPAYIVEIATVEIRGFLTSGFQVAFALGVFLVMSLGTFLRWSWLAICGAMIIVVGSYLMCAMPESPPWLVRASKNAEAIRGLIFFKGSESQAMKEYANIVEHLSEEPKGSFSLLELLKPNLYKPLFYAVALMFFQQFSGINALMSYAVELFQNNKSSIDPFISAAIVAFVQLVMTALSSILVDKVGRRVLYITSGICMALSLTVSGVYSKLSHPYSAEQLTNWSWVPLLSFVTYIAAFSLGFGPIPFVVIPEMVPTRVRSLVIAVASVMCSFFGFVVTKLFDDMRNVIGLEGIYWTYASCALLGFLFYFIFIPETKGKTIREINRSLSRLDEKE